MLQRTFVFDNTRRTARILLEFLAMQTSTLKAHFTSNKPPSLYSYLRSCIPPDKPPVLSLFVVRCVFLSFTQASDTWCPAGEPQCLTRSNESLAFYGRWRSVVLCGHSLHSCGGAPGESARGANHDFVIAGGGGGRSVPPLHWSCPL